MNTENKFFSTALIVLLIASILAGCEEYTEPSKKVSKIARFKSGQELIKAFEEAREGGRGYFGVITEGVMMKATSVAETAVPQADSGREYSETNIQVEGVDEADIIKTDGDYIYTLTQGNLVIVKAYPSDEAEILSTTALDNFNPREIFIHKDRLLIFGSISYKFEKEEQEIGKPVKEIAPYPRYVRTMSVRLYDISDREDPELLRTVDFEGNYLNSRKIDEYAYFVVNSYLYYKAEPMVEEIIPLYRDSEKSEEFEPIAKPTEIGYVEPIQAENFITIASISMTDEDEDIEKEVIVGSGQNVYASLNNLYIAQTSWPRYSIVGKLIEDYSEKTVITKFSLDDGEVEYEGTGEVKGHILNQFSMDEHKGNFRIATTIGHVSRQGRGSSNTVYVLNEDLDVIGELEDLAPGEKIYSVRFMGDRGYVVTFKKVDPLFVIDLSDPDDPAVLGKLKIPGYSDYLHPYDKNRLIGIGKETIEAEEGDFAWYQGVKMAIFDVTDVENPIELNKVVIGDRGTDSPILRDHKAFLFDKEKNLLVIPITLAEIKEEKTRDNQYGEYTFQGAYVYDLSLEDGFDLRGRVTHYDDDEAFKKSGYYFRGDSSIQRSLYIEDVLYTLSNKRLQLNDLDDLGRLNVLDFK